MRPDLEMMAEGDATLVGEKGITVSILLSHHDFGSAYSV
jgi:ATP-binding cassette subfamily C (CFTR/MRP) protein 1